jgi:predicted Zn-dependent peptidase
MVLAQIQDLRNRPPGADELALHQRFFLGSAAGRLETPGQVAGELERDALAGLPLDRLRRSCQTIAEADASKCQALVHRLVDPGHMLIVVVGDASRIAGELRAIAPVTVLDRDGKETKGKAAGQ